MSVAEQLAAAPRSSIEKLEEQLDLLAGVKGTDAGQTMLLTTVRAMLPTLKRLGYIPTDPAELDDILLIAARWALGMRSDTAWQPETMTDLFLGPENERQAPEEAP